MLGNRWSNNMSSRTGFVRDGVGVCVCAVAGTIPESQKPWTRAMRKCIFIWHWFSSHDPFQFRNSYARYVYIVCFRFHRRLVQILLIPRSRNAVTPNCTYSICTEQWNALLLLCRVNGCASAKSLDAPSPYAYCMCLCSAEHLPMQCAHQLNPSRI